MLCLWRRTKCCNFSECTSFLELEDSWSHCTTQILSCISCTKRFCRTPYVYISSKYCTFIVATSNILMFVCYDKPLTLTVTVDFDIRISFGSSFGNIASKTLSTAARKTLPKVITIKTINELRATDSERTKL